MEFFLPFRVQQYPFTISYRDKIMFIGSCFSEEIGNKMSELKFDVLQNPNGILYDPLSIVYALDSYIQHKNFNEGDLVQLNGLWHSWKHHSVFSGIDKIKVVEEINRSQSKAHQYLKEAQLLIITLGTSFCYKLKEQQQHVSNCHKAPASFFIKELLSAEEIISGMSNLIKKLGHFNPSLKILITVSPVKHTRDGVVENTRSKAILIESVHQIVEKHTNSFYFPSYEMVTDVLRDYRFYKTDMVHPNGAAIDFVFENFCNAFLDHSNKKLMLQVKEILAAVNHKAFMPQSEAHQKFIVNQLKKIELAENKNPFIDFAKEKTALQKNLLS